jgi:hypothetical protein
MPDRLPPLNWLPEVIIGAPPGRQDGPQGSIGRMSNSDYVVHEYLHAAIGNQGATGPQGATASIPRARPEERVLCPTCQKDMMVSGFTPDGHPYATPDCNCDFEESVNFFVYGFGASHSGIRPSKWMAN